MSKFEVGDRVKCIKGFATLEGGGPSADHIYTITASDDDFVRIMDETGPPGWEGSRFRLATPEEIAAAVKDATITMKSDDGRAYTVNVGIKPSTEIPAADFDFSTIKAGDEVVMRLKVAGDGLDKDGEVRIEGRSDFYRYFRPDQIASVIPAAKPKTLRERAIGAAMRVCGGHEGSMASLIDAVLAEVEKGE